MSYVYVGTYNDEDEDGIYILSLDREQGRLERVGSAPGRRPSFLALHPNGRWLYAVGEVEGAKGGQCLAFDIEADGARLSFKNHAATVGNGPCHLSIAPDERHILVANYSGGSVTVLPIQDDGSVGEAVDFVQHEGSSVHPRRQQQPHPHSILPAPDGDHVVVPDLGLDRVVIYGLDHGKLSPAEQPWVELEPGAGPRHFSFHPNGRFAYVINELNDTVTAFHFHGGEGRLETVQTVVTVPGGFDGENYTAEVVVHPSGRFLYGSNRGHDSIAIFAIDQETGELEAVGHEPSGGGWPRNFTVTPEGDFLLAANQHGDNLLLFAVDSESGRLERLHEEQGFPSPVCVRVADPS